MRIDELTVHADDIQAGSGAEFYGTPIREMSIVDVDVREELDTQRRVQRSLGEKSVPVDLLPGEVVTGEVIRRSTAAEVVGDAFYKKDVVLENGRKLDLNEGYPREALAAGALITWRPNGENFAFIHEEVASELSV